MQYINIHNHQRSIEDNESSILNIFPQTAFSELEKEGCYSIGLHPWHANDENASRKIKIIEKFAEHPKVLAIGEIGLDRRCGVNFEIQKQVLHQQLIIAQRIKKPVIWHLVKSYADILSLNKSIPTHTPWILHGFHSKPTMAKSLIDNGFYFSFGAMLFNEKSGNEKLLPLIPIDKLFFETDESDIDILKIYEKAAEVLSLSVEKLMEITNENFYQVFGKSAE